MLQVLTSCHFVRCVRFVTARATTSSILNTTDRYGSGTQFTFGSFYARPVLDAQLSLPETKRISLENMDELFDVEDFKVS